MSLKIALTGNPNSGKTSLFNRLTGATQKVGNWSGVTVEVKEGIARFGKEQVTVIDLPGTYSLCTCSMEELVARNFIVDEKPDVVVDVIDGTNLDRHLYLAVQLMELGVRPILALNMWDEVKDKGLYIDISLLSRLLGLTIVTTNARTGEGVADLLEAAIKQGGEKCSFSTDFSVKLPDELESAIIQLKSHVNQIENIKYNSRWLVLQLFEQDRIIESFVKALPQGKQILAYRDQQIQNLTKILGDSPESFITESRYGFIAGAVKETVKQTKPNRVEISDMIDTVVTHRFWAYPIFIVFMWVLFQATFRLGEYPMGWIDSMFGWFHGLTSNSLPQGVLRDLVADGIIAGVGGVIVFLPNILILFLGISIMEDTGYMARAAFITDKLMHRIGLHGKSFIPMIMGLGCSVPAIMAARTLESKKDRIKTILLTPLVSCSARLPVFVLFAGAFFPDHAANVVFLFQVVFGFGAFILMGFVFKHTLFQKEEEYPFVMELPPYRLPTFQSILIHMWYKTEHYLKKMGGVVLLFSIILWWLGAYPKAPQIEKQYEQKIETVKMLHTVSQEEKNQNIRKIQLQKHAAVMEQTYIGRIGKFLEPIVKPFGSDWRGAVSLVTGFVAKEVVVGSMGVLYAVGDDENDKSEGLRDALKQNFTPLSAFAFMLFVLLYIPCVVALITAVKELKNWKWSVFSVSYQLLLAWAAATIVYQIGKITGL
ncbi:MAG TPA: ferrous iron transport protein B [Chitinispirillaceae bacterium]|nr:ferrous iron transport protein B [Chitinispirillaceae bacterium]